METVDTIILCVVMFLAGVFLVIYAVMAIVFLLFREKKPATPEMKEDPCESCLRWDECNGVDEKCPGRDTNE